MDSFAPTSLTTTCYHCGEECDDKHIRTEEKLFCCEGCKLVYEIINQNGLCNYYDISKNPGLQQKIKVREGKFAFLDNEEITSKLIHFRTDKQAHIHLYLPQMHCSSCIWLLENLTRLNAGIISSTVNFLKKEISVVFDTEKISLRKLAELLTKIGYEPHITLRDMDSSKIKKYDRSRIYKIGIAGFCFGNIMLLSFPEYFSSGDIQEIFLKKIFTYINFGLSLPVFFYCASEFFSSAYKSIRQKFLNIDAPIALAIVITFVRSLYEILSGTGAGYLDSMTGIVFFMLIGRFFQDKTYQSLAFDRDYTSYFPIGVTRISTKGPEEQIPVSEIKKGDRLLIHSQEIIPADGILFMGKGNIDYSFVTGESLPSEKSIGELVYAGGKQIGASIELEVIKEVSQSYLTQLWNNDVFKKQTEEKKISFIHKISRYFTYILFSIATATAFYWLANDSSRILNAITSILIVACPCALLLSATFTNGNMMAKLQASGFFLRNANVIENISEADHIVFDKTGTISIQSQSSIFYEGNYLSREQKILVRSLVVQSGHPLSRAIADYLPKTQHRHLKDFEERKGQGCQAIIDDQLIKIGSETYVSGFSSLETASESSVYFSIDKITMGYFKIKTVYWEGLPELVESLKRNFKLSILSGDNASEKETLQHLFGAQSKMLFEQSPQDKLDYINYLQSQGNKVIMIGDGLNDAGALQQSNAGIVISDDINNFSPACDAILEGRQFSKLKVLIEYCKKEKVIIFSSFVISILYNLVGLYYAVQGNLSPVIAAILMPLSSVSIVGFTTVVSSLYAGKIKN